MVLRENHFEGGRFRVVGGDEVGRLPVKQGGVCEEGSQVGDSGNQLVATDRQLLEVFEKPGVFGCDVRVDERLTLEQRRRGNDEANRLEIADPLLMGQEFGVFGHVSRTLGARVIPC